MAGVLPFLGLGCGGGSSDAPKTEVPPFVQPPALPAWTTPAWTGQTLTDAGSLAGWTVEKDSGSSGSLALVEGLRGKAVELSWDLGTGQWVQARCDFPQRVDLSGRDLFGACLKGSSPGPRRVTVLFEDADGVYVAMDLDGINTITRWMIDWPLPRKGFGYAFSIGTTNTAIDWTRIRSLLVAVKPLAGSTGGSGRLTLDDIRADTAGAWPAPAAFEANVPHAQASRAAVDYLLAQQQPCGLLQSWAGEPSPRAYLYDEALALIVLSREGTWTGASPQNAEARAADALAAFLVAQQKPDGHWARAWNPVTAQEVTDDGWVGDQAWAVIALRAYAARSGGGAAVAKAEACAQWLLARLEPSGKAAASTEGTLDTFWALHCTGHDTEAAKVRDYLLTTVWDAGAHYFWRGYGAYPDPVVAMDCASWASFFARHPLVGHPERGLQALGFVRRTLLAQSEDGALRGFDGMGPVSIWCEGTGQYVCAGGPDSAYFRQVLLSLQRPGGGMPGSTGSWSSDASGWLTTWTGVAPTAWLYFALNGPPFPAD